jgi:hypothetical protein
MTSEAIEEYWGDIRPPRPEPKPSEGVAGIDLSKIPLYREPPKPDGELTFTYAGVQYRAQITEIRMEQPDYYRGRGGPPMATMTLRAYPMSYPEHITMDMSFAGAPIASVTATPELRPVLQARLDDYRERLWR